MTQQTTQELTISKKFGRYDIKDEFEHDYGNLIFFREGSEYNAAEDIHSKLNKLSSKFGGIIIQLAIYNIQDNHKELLYHIQDSSVCIFRIGKKSSLSIYHKDSIKRQETRRFLEEILS